VSIVLDQLGSNAFERYLPLLDADGLLRTAVERGRWYRSQLEYAGTNTAPGHATIYTGVNPRLHGVVANDVFDGRGKVPIVADGEHEIIGDPEHDTAGPGLLRVDTVGDVLRTRAPEAKVVSLSLKGRAAVVPGGHHPTMVAFFEPAVKGFTTSTFYAPSLPAWIADFNAAQPLERRIEVWKPERPDLYEHELGPDARPGEADWQGLGRAFPHDPNRTKKPAKTFLVTPASAAYLLDLARAAVRAYGLGGDDVPDLLAISISTTDYAGHSFGWKSWEYLDDLIRIDRELGRFVRELEATTSVAVVVTADHGGTDVPEAQPALAGRIVQHDLAEALDGCLRQRRGDGEWIAAYVQPFLYLGSDGVAADGEALSTELRACAASLGTVERIVRVSDPSNTDVLGRHIFESIAANGPGQYFVVPDPAYVFDPDHDEGRGTSHGTPSEADRHVPVLLYGVGVTAGTKGVAASQTQVAATLAAMLGIDPPADAGPALAR